MDGRPAAQLCRSYKCSITPEVYSDYVKIQDFMDFLILFRLVVSDMSRHTKCFVQAKTDTTSQCPFCSGFIEEEGHIVLWCPWYVTCRLSSICMANVF